MFDHLEGAVLSCLHYGYMFNLFASVCSFDFLSARYCSMSWGPTGVHLASSHDSTKTSQDAVSPNLVPESRSRDSTENFAKCFQRPASFLDLGIQSCRLCTDLWPSHSSRLRDTLFGFLKCISPLVLRKRSLRWTTG